MTERKTTMRQKIIDCANHIKANFSGEMPKIALVLGSGLNALAEELKDATVFSYRDLPHFPSPTVAGHSGRMHIGTLSGTPLICLQGRVHAYEGQPDENIAIAPRVMRELGVETFILTNAAGSLNVEAAPGSLMIIKDHINLGNVNPLVGINDEYFGVRFPDMLDAWNADHRTILRDIAKDNNMPVSEGVYLMVKGPNFETPAEINAFRTMGADAVGMSTVPECIVAHHCGMKVVGISGITNLAAGMTGNALTHAETMQEGAKATLHLSNLLKLFIKQIG